MQIWSEYVLYILLVETIPTRFFDSPSDHKNLPKVKTLPQGLFVLTAGFWQFRQVFVPLLNVYFNNFQINEWLHLSSSFWGIPLRCDLFRKITDQKKFPFIATNNWIVLAIPRSVKYFYAPNSPFEFPVIPEKWWRKEEEERQL